MASAPTATGTKGPTAMLLAVVLLCGLAGGVRGEEDGVEAGSTDPRAAFLADVCRRIEKAAQKWKLPPAYFARLIWKESRFDPDAVSPKGASGIAQFLPATAQLRRLDDPFDPRSAIPASAHFLSDLRDEFGNLGLAAAAYNAGPNRVRNWRAGRGSLPNETQDFVLAITGHAAQDWSAPEPPKPEFALHRELPFQEACRAMPIRRMTPRPFEYASAEWQPWGAHLTAHWTPTRALALYANIQRRYPELLGGLNPMVLRVTSHGRGYAPRFEIRIGKPNRKQAESFCRELQKAGGACLVLRNVRG